MKQVRKILLTVFCFSMAFQAGAVINGDFGGLKLSPLFTDGMVLQRDKELHIIGKANAGREVKIQFGKITGKTVSDFQGNWEIVLPAFPANKKGQKLTVSSEKDENQIVLANGDKTRYQDRNKPFNNNKKLEMAFYKKQQ
jgi:hypothetical protein